MSTLALRDRLGMGQFGFAVQALLALIMGRLGGRVLEINSAGHPDIVLEYEGRNMAIEVEVVGSKRNVYSLTDADYFFAKPTLEREGYVAILDLHEPVRWHLVKLRSLVQPIVKRYSLAELITVEDEQLTVDCNQKFHYLIINYAERIAWLRFEGIRKRVLNGNFSLD